MLSQYENRILGMLHAAYTRLGVSESDSIQGKITEALNYLIADREHYIEVADSDTPEYLITTQNGVICRMVPLAQHIIRDQLEDHVREHSAIFSLMVTENGARFIYSYCYATLHDDPTKNTYSHPVYQHAQLSDIRDTLQVAPPQQIRPIATPQQWEAYAMMFTAFAQLDKTESINNIPRRTERAALWAAHAPSQEWTIGNKSYTGKLVPLGQEKSMWDTYREDHRYSYRKELCLLITPEGPRYVLKTLHVHNYFKKTILGDEPGAVSYEDTHQKQETTYEFVTLSELSEDMYPLYT